MKIIRFVPLLGDAASACNRLAARTLKTPFAAELVHLPYIVFHYRLLTQRLFSSPKEIEGYCFVDLAQGFSYQLPSRTALDFSRLGGDVHGIFHLLAGLQPARASRYQALEECLVPEESVLPPILDEPSALNAGKTWLKYDFIRFVGGLIYRRFEIQITPPSHIVYHPFWIIYCPEKDQKVQATFLDALTGEKVKGHVARSISLSLLHLHGKAKTSPFPARSSTLNQER